MFGLFGPNGAGKTTTVKMLTTLLLPTAGTARILGLDVIRQTAEVRRHIGFAFSGSRGLYNRLTAIQNLKYFAQLYALDPAITRKRIPELLELAGLINANGWPCTVSKELGKFRGPGRKDDPCPFANLAMLKVLSELPEWRDCHACHLGANTLLTLWDESMTCHPYMFYMGTDFRKLKVPFVWYDLMHVFDVLSRFSWLRNDAQLLDMLAILKNKMDQQGRFSLESVWTAWKDWEFGQKKEPSRWLTLSAWRIIGRIETGSVILG